MKERYVYNKQLEATLIIKQCTSAFLESFDNTANSGIGTVIGGEMVWASTFRGEDWVVASREAEEDGEMAAPVSI